MRRSVLWLQGKLSRMFGGDVAIALHSTQPRSTEVDASVLALVEDAGQRKWVCMHCPGCGEVFFRLPLNARMHPHWTIRIDWWGRPTLHPSIRQRSHCGAHFWLRKGVVDWCSDSGCR